MSREKRLVRTESERAYWRRSRHSPECSNKLVALTGGNRKKKGQQERKKDITTTK